MNSQYPDASPSPNPQRPERPTISRTDLQWRLMRVAQVRSVVSMLSAFIGLLGVALIPGATDAGWPLVIAYFGTPFLEPVTRPAAPLSSLGRVACGMEFCDSLLVSQVMTKAWCEKRVLCPHCGSSLWECGTGNFKPRRMNVREGVDTCPGCGAAIV